MIPIPAHFQPFFVIITLLLVFGLIYSRILLPLRGLIMATLIFLVFDIIQPEHILNSLANPSVAAVIMLILIASALINTFPILEYLKKIMITRKGYKPFLFSSMLYSSLLSAVLNNTAVVAIMTPLVYRWGVGNKISPGKLLMPLSFLAICGGMITLIGTSTTLVLNGFMSTHQAGELNYMKLLLGGLAVSGMGILWFLTLGHKLLPQKKELLKKIVNERKDYLIELMVGDNSILIGKRIMEGGLRSLESLYLAEIIRDNTSIAPVTPNTIVQQGDRLIFAGDTENFKELMNEENDLQMPGDSNSHFKFEKVSEVVISYNSSLIGQTLKTSEFRARYDASVFAVHRNGSKLSGKIGSIRLLAGDVLMVFCGNDFSEKINETKDLYLISDAENPVKKVKYRFLPVIIIGCVIIAGLIWGQLQLVSILFLVTAILFISNVLSYQTLKKEFDLNLTGLLIFSLAVGQGIIESGTGEIIAEFIISATSSSSVGSLVSLMILTVLLTTFITNVAAVSIAFPIAFSLASSFPHMAESYYLGIAFAASAAFMTPISYQTNLMVAGPGGYTFTDYLKNGSLYLLVYLVTITMVLIGLNN